MQEEAGRRRRAIAESSAVQSKPQRKGVIIVLNVIRTAWLVVWAELAPELWFSRWEEGSGCLCGAEEQEIFLPIPVLPLQVFTLSCIPWGALAALLRVSH